MTQDAPQDTATPTHATLDPDRDARPFPGGIHVPLVTPFNAAGQVAVDALEALAHEVLDAGARGIVALGTTGESAGLDAAERDLVTDVCARVCRERGRRSPSARARAGPGRARPRWPGSRAGSRYGRPW